MQFDQPVAGNAERHDVFDPRPRVVGKVARRRHADQPFPAAERAEALRHSPVTGDAAEAEPDIRQVHDPQSGRAVLQYEIGLGR